MEDVRSTREPLVITKRGKPVAKLVQRTMAKDDFIGRLKGVFRVVGDIESPAANGSHRDPARLARAGMGSGRSEAPFERRGFAIRRARRSDGLAVSAITTWEIAWMLTTQRVQGYGTIEASIRQFLEGVAVRPITEEIAALAAQFPDDYPRDPPTGSLEPLPAPKA